MTNTLVQDSITVHGVNPVAKAKFKTAGGLLIDPDKKLWINVIAGASSPVHRARSIS